MCTACVLYARDVLDAKCLCHQNHLLVYECCCLPVRLLCSWLMRFSERVSKQSVYVYTLISESDYTSKETSLLIIWTEVVCLNPLKTRGN
jgi:hypothetical protein